MEMLAAPSRSRLIYWADPLESGTVFGSVLVLLVAVRYLSLISVLGNLCLALVTSTVAFRIYRSVLFALNKVPDASHPFQKYLDTDITISQAKVQEVTTHLVEGANHNLRRLKSLFMMDDLVETLKFALGMYFLTFVGNAFNGTTILIILWITTFMGPKLYQDNQAKVDEALGPIVTKIRELKLISPTPPPLGSTATPGGAKAPPATK